VSEPAAPRTYRGTFSTAQSAESYDEQVYAPGSSAELLWRVEAAILERLAAGLRRARGRLDYLDFACGTGRVLALLAPYADAATGIDVSPCMLERAAARGSGARLLRKDVTAPGDEIEGRYDLVTAFRFRTNAEPPLRRAALAALAPRLEPDGLLLINTHGNPWSYRLLTLPYHWLCDRRAGRPLFGYLSARQARRELERAGFAVERTIGMGFVPQKLLPLLPARLALAIERGLAGKPLVQRLGLNQILVCRRSGG
jgi:SAM-dependent methyltransferase